MTQFLYQGKVVQGILFDLDGTLYDQKKMHAYMTLDLLRYYLVRPHKLYEIRIIYYFRKMRYSIPEHANIEYYQYKLVADYLKIPTEEVKRVIIFWMEERPLLYIKKCRYPCVVDLFKKIKSENIKIAVVSDYPVEKKLKHLELTADVMVYSGDTDVNNFKPNPTGFLKAAEKLNIPPENCIVIGDRDDKDGSGARNAGMFFIKMHSDLIKIFSKEAQS